MMADKTFLMTLGMLRTPGGAELRILNDGDYYLMTGGPYGEHRLHRDSTDTRRLMAHWAGYFDNACDAERRAS